MWHPTQIGKNGVTSLTLITPPAMQRYMILFFLFFFGSWTHLADHFVCEDGTSRSQVLRRTFYKTVTP